jgi:galactose-1-phosphate uridylyltransferase
MTAVEYLIEQLAKNGILHSSDIAKAKEMEKQQIMDCFLDVSKELLGDLSQKNLDKLKGASEQYYNETFKSE